MTTIGSLFTGYGGLDMGVAMALDPDARVAWTSDIEPGPCKLAATRWPDTPNLGDITKINWADVEPVDIICGGSPCQDLSLAGKRAGMAAGTRSGLWESMAAAAETIQPRLVVWENVQGALSAKAYSPVESETTMLGTGAAGPALRAAGRVAGDLAGLGYDCRWQIVRASDARAPHQRARLFLVGHPHGQPWDMRRPAAPRKAAGRRPQCEPAGPSDGTLIPPPTASDHKTGRHQESTGHSLTQAVQLLHTPIAQPSGNNPPEHLRKKPTRRPRHRPSNHRRKRPAPHRGTPPDTAGSERAQVVRRIRAEPTPGRNQQRPYPLRPLRESDRPMGADHRPGSPTPFDPTTPPRRQTTAQHTVRRMAHGPTRRPRHRPRPST